MQGDSLTPFTPGIDPVGRRFRLGGSPTDPVLEIVGLAKDARYSRLRDENPPTVYVPYTQQLAMLGAATFEVRYLGDPAALVAALRQVVERIEPNLPMFDVRTQAEQAARSLAPERQFSRLAACLAFFGLLLASIGLYGIVSYGASRRTREIGIRMALGARREDVVTMVLREGLVLVGVGAVLGLAASVASGRVVASLLYGLTPNDPTTLLAVTAILVGVSVLAGYLPARRASRVDPAAALRCE